MVTSGQSNLVVLLWILVSCQPHRIIIHLRTNWPNSNSNCILTSCQPRTAMVTSGQSHEASWFHSWTLSVSEGPLKTCFAQQMEKMETTSRKTGNSFSVFQKLGVRQAGSKGCRKPVFEVLVRLAPKDVVNQCVVHLI